MGSTLRSKHVKKSSMLNLQETHLRRVFIVVVSVRGSIFSRVVGFPEPHRGRGDRMHWSHGCTAIWLVSMLCYLDPLVTLALLYHACNDPGNPKLFCRPSAYIVQ